ncbi:uncharacterized protein Dvir_GJ25716 [Drosophila virilis]|uniref:Uncharacterized protein n=1 Tax=Drosophila virilis TaxID=7244 RepID=A0A0Q9WVB1_DROVI|nr:uncharacterized protein Dvir_GJ25716 [Drosophila virilis]
MRMEKQRADNQSSLINSKLSQLDQNVQQNAKNLNAKAPEIQNSYGIVDSGNKTLDIIRNKLNKAADATLKELYDRLGDFAKRLSIHVANIGSESKRPKENEQHKLLSLIGKQVQDLTPIARNHSKTEDDQSQNIITAKGKLRAKFDDQPEQLELADSLDAKIKKYIERGINELELKLNASNSSPTGNSAHSSDIFKKLDDLEAGFNDLREQRNGKEQDMLNKIADLKSRLKEVNDKIFNAEAAHKKCLVECDFGELPSIEELQARLQTLKIYLRKRKQANKRSP